MQPAGYAVVPFVGPDGSGKSSLATALANGHRMRDASSVSPPRVVQVAGMNVGVFEVRSLRRVTQHVDFPNTDAQNGLIASTPIAGAILVVSALDGPVEGTVDSLVRVHHAGAARVVVALSKCDAVEDPELLDLVEMEIREVLKKYHYDGDNTPVARTSARGEGRWGESVMQLAAAVDSWL